MDEVNLEQIAKNSQASQDAVELYSLLKRVQHINPTVLLEIGSWRGHLQRTFEQAFPALELQMGIELDVKNIRWMEDNIGLPGKCLIFAGISYSRDMVLVVEKMLKGRVIDFLFIDGDHTYDAVKLDFETYLPFVRKGGIIAFHDVIVRDNPDIEVGRFWNEIRHNYRHTLHVGDGSATGTGILYI